MAHNTLTIASQEPNTLSQFTTVPVIQPFLLLSGLGSTSAYSNSGATSFSRVRFYSPSATTNNSINATLNRVGTNSDWVDQITLLGGKKYIVQCSINFSFSATGFFAIQYKQGGLGIGPIAYIGDAASTSIQSSALLTKTVDLTSAGNTTLTVDQYSSSNVSTIASQGTVPSEYSYLLVRQLT